IKCLQSMNSLLDSVSLPRQLQRFFVQEQSVTVHKKPLLWVSFVIVTSLSLGASPIEAATKKAPVKSKSQQSLARKASLARQRAVAAEREAAESAVPRYKVDASGD